MNHSSIQSTVPLAPRDGASRRLTLLLFVLICTVHSVGFGQRAESRLPLAENPESPYTSPQETVPRRIDHVVVIFQENRSTDNLFHGFPGADTVDGGFNSKGEYILLHPVPLASSYDLNHSHRAFLKMYDDGRMDGADKISVACLPKHEQCPPANPQFVYVRHSDVRAYFKLAEQFTFADRMFQTNQGPSFPAHQFIISGTSAPSDISKLFAAENPFQQSGPPVYSTFLKSGCTASAGVTVNLIDPSGNESKTVRPCFDHITLPDLLDAAGISWRYYSVGNTWNALWNGPAAITHLRFGQDWSKVLQHNTQIFLDIRERKLPAVSWVIPVGQCSDHPSASGACGPSWVGSIVNAIARSPYWYSTAVFITWDDWGGFYDHVAPPIYNSYEYGFRVPLIVVSPYAKRHYVSHETHDFGSILKFIEKNFGLPSLGFADLRADDLSDCFDFDQQFIPYHPVITPLVELDFLNRKDLPEDPDTD